MTVFLVQPNIQEPDFVMAPPINSIWIKVENIAVNIQRTDEGVVVDLFSDAGVSGTEGASLAGTYAFFAEALPSELVVRS